MSKLYIYTIIYQKLQIGRNTKPNKYNNIHVTKIYYPLANQYMYSGVVNFPLTLSMFLVVIMFLFIVTTY